MLKGLDEFINKFVNTRLVFPALFLVCFLSYGLSLNMYFWKDDFALMIKAQNPEESVGFFGPGIKGDGAYRYITIPFALLYPTFGLNASLYFLVGIILYFFATISVFYLAKEVFEDKLKSFLTALIFASGYIGADSIYGLTNSYQTSWVIIFLCLSLIFFLRSFKSGYIGHYILSLFLFALSLETGYIRAHGFFLIVVSSAIIVINHFSIKRILEIIIKIIPFFLLFRFFYLTSIPAQVGNSQLAKSLESGDYNYFYNPGVTFINVFLPTPIINWSLNILNNLFIKQISPLKFQLILFTIFIIILLALLVGLLYKRYFKNLENIRLLQIAIFSLGTIMGSFIGVFYIGAAATYLESTHRYLSTALIGLAFFWVSAFAIALSKFKKTNLYLTLIIFLICSCYLILVNYYAIESMNIRTTPQKQFFSQLKNEIPQINSKTFLYFDVSNKNNSNAKFGNIFGAGSIGGSGEITMHYPGIDRYSVVTSVSDFQDFVNKYKQEGGDINTSFWFYFEDNELKNRTLQFRNILSVGKTTSLKLDQFSHETSLINKDGKIISDNTSFEVNVPEEVLLLTDGILKFNLSIIPQESTMSAQLINENDEIYLRYLLSKTKLKNESKATVLNHFQNHVAENLFDSKLETSWMANRGPWHNLTNGVTDQIQFIDISLDDPINLGGILFTNGHSLRTPTKYKIFTKENGLLKEIKNQDSQNERVTNEVWFEKLGPVLTNQVRIELLDTSSHDAPQISEIELVEEQYAALDLQKAQQIETDPSILLSQNPNSELVKNYFAKNGKLSLIYKSNKDNDFNVPTINFDVKGLGETYTYEIPIPANGINLEKLKLFNLNFPAKYSFSNFEFINPPISYYLNNDKPK